MTYIWGQGGQSTNATRKKWETGHSMMIDPLEISRANWKRKSRTRKRTSNSEELLTLKRHIMKHPSRHDVHNILHFKPPPAVYGTLFTYPTTKIVGERLSLCSRSKPTAIYSLLTNPTKWYTTCSTTRLIRSRKRTSVCRLIIERALVWPLGRKKKL